MKGPDGREFLHIDRGPIKYGTEGGATRNLVGEGEGRSDYSILSEDLRVMMRYGLSVPQHSRHGSAVVNIYDKYAEPGHSPVTKVTIPPGTHITHGLLTISHEE